MFFLVPVRALAVAVALSLVLFFRSMKEEATSQGWRCFEVDAGSFTSRIGLSLMSAGGLMAMQSMTD